MTEAAPSRNSDGHTPTSDGHTRSVFYVGGSYAANDSKKHTLQGQMYVEHLVPAGKTTRRYPLVFIPGGGRTGVDFLDKPCGRPGWASFFLAHGYECYIVDPPFGGRSPWSPSVGTYRCCPAEYVQDFWTNHGTVSPTPWPTAQLQTQWMGTGVMGDPFFDAMFASMVPTLDDPMKQQLAVQQGLVGLLNRIARPAVLVGHSQGGLAGWLAADAQPGLTRALVAVEPAGPPFEALISAGPRLGRMPYGLTHAPLTFDPTVTDPASDLKRTKIPGENGRADVLLQADEPPPRKLINLVDVPVLIVTGEASRHAQYEWATAAFLRQAGVRVEHCVLAHEGVHGNSHMMMLEDNSDEIARLILNWVCALHGEGREAGHENMTSEEPSCRRKR